MIKIEGEGLGGASAAAQDEGGGVAKQDIRVSGYGGSGDWGGGCVPPKKYILKKSRMVCNKSWGWSVKSRNQE